LGENKKELARVTLKKQAAPGFEPFRSTPEQLAELGREFGVEAVDLGRLRIAVSVLDWVPRETALSHAMVPVRSGDDVLTVAMADPRNVRVSEELAFVTGKQVEVLVAPKQDVLAFIERAYAAQRRGDATVGGPAAPDEGERALGGEEPPFDEFSGRESLSLHDVPTPEPGPGGPPLDVLELIVESERAPTSEAYALVVDDDAAIRGLVVRLLQSRGVRSVQAATGAEALRILSSDEAPPVLMVLDAMLPEVHGFEVLRQIRADARLSALPVIVLTAVHKGWRFAEDLRALSGIQHYIEKPFEAAQLFTAVDELFGQGQQLGLSDPARRCLEGSVAAIARGDFAAAEREVVLGLEAEPEAHQLHFQLGITYGKQGRVFEAVSAFERAIGIQPRYFAGVKNLAVLYQRAGFQNKSTEMWERALALAPDQATRESIRDHLLRLI
jgi:CheY-like chemotaxis protein